MKRISMALAALASFAIAAPLLADDGIPGAANAAARAALAEKADLPAKLPTLPSQAAERATVVHDDVAFGKRGEAMRAAHAEAGDQGAAADDSSNRSAQGAAASAAGAANADAHAAAGQARAEEARKTHSKPTTPPPHGP